MQRKKSNKAEIYQRYKKILMALSEKIELSHEEIKAKFAVGLTEKVIWQDISALDQMGLVEKIRGGVRARSAVKDAEVYRHVTENLKSKEIIARGAIEQVLKPDLMTNDEKKICIFLGTGSTALILFREIIKDSDLRNFNFKIVSNNVAFTREIYPSNITLILSGGEYYPQNESLIDKAKDMFSNYPAKYAFLSASTLNYSKGLLGYNTGEGKVKGAMAQNAEELYILADSSKFRYASGEVIATFEWKEKALQLNFKELNISKVVNFIVDESINHTNILTEFIDESLKISDEDLRRHFLFATAGPP